MKLSFALSSKSSSKQNSKPRFTESEPESTAQSKQFVTEFVLSKTLNPNSKPNLIIPPKENEWRPHKKMKNLASLPSLQSDPTANSLTFELAGNVDDATDENGMSYGLNLRQSGGGDGKLEDLKSGSGESKTENMLLEKLKYDLQRLPDDQGFDEFKDVPVEGFGAALLAGYGWKEGRGIGKNAKEDVKVKQYTKHTGKEGLGFVADPPASDNNDKKSREVRNDDNRVSVSANVNGSSNGESKRGRERDEKSDGFVFGKDVRVIAGGREVYGLKGRIVERSNADWVILKVNGSNQEVKFRVSEIADLGSKEEEKCLRKLKALEIESKQKRSSESSRERRDSGKEEKKRWLRNHIRVRIVSKDLKGGRFYLKKGEVVDVISPYVCDISMDETKELVQGVDQHFLETALPRRGGPVLVLYGKHKGAFGNLVEKDLDREIGVVQDADTRELINVKLEQIAEYVGDPSMIDY